MDFTSIEKELESAFHTLAGQWGLSAAIKTLVTVAVLTLVIQGARLLLVRLTKNRISPQTRLLLNKTFAYGGFVVVSLVFFDSIGVNLTAFLGAAGIVGIAVGFAAQSSISNVIAGIFLIAEKPFSVGDVINTVEVSGIVLSIDILSVKLKTFDNTLVRIPNELLIKAKVINVTRFPIRRLDFQITVSYRDNLERTMAVIREVIAANRYALANPEPFLMVREFAASGIVLSVGIWFEKDDILALRNSVMIELLERFRETGIDIPFPQLSVHLAPGDDKPAAPGASSTKP